MKAAWGLSIMCLSLATGLAQAKTWDTSDIKPPSQNPKTWDTGDIKPESQNLKSPAPQDPSDQQCQSLQADEVYIDDQGRRVVRLRPNTECQPDHQDHSKRATP